MRPTWLPLSLALIVPGLGLLGACGPGVDTDSTGGGGTTTTSNGGGGSTATSNPTGGAGGVGGDTGGGGTGGTGGVGGFEPPPNDLCPGEKVAPAIGETITLNGTTNGAADNYTTFCADTSEESNAPDVVYQLEIPATSTVTLSIAATGFTPVLSLRRSDCSSRQAGDACLNLGTGNIETVVALEAGTYWVVVDSADEKTGNFKFDVKVAAPTCGDGAINPGEQCDPAVTAMDDGCFNPGTPKQCSFGEPPPDPAIVGCPGGLITMGMSDSFQLGPYNNGAGNSEHLGTCSPEPAPDFPSGPENVFHIVPKANGTLTVQIGHDEDGTTLYCNDPGHVCADFIMYLRKGSCASTVPTDELGCTDFTENPNSPFGFDELLTISAPVTANTDYWLIVDGLDPTFGIGPYYLQLKLQP